MGEDAPRTAAERPAHAPFPIIGLGASAGGVPALQQFFAAMPPANGMAFVVIMHLSPEHDSQIAAILQHSTAMPVHQVTEPVRVAPETVYVIPPGKQLVMNDGMLVLVELERPDGRRVAIDRFFRTLADTHTTHAACIVLSGIGADGSVGITRARETGGITIAQDPEEAEYDAMPRNAIGTGLIDFVLPIAAMPARLLALWRNAERSVLPGGAPAADTGQAAEEALQELLAAVHARTGQDLAHYARPALLRRVGRRMRVTLTPDLPSYRDYLRANPGEVDLLLHDLLLNVSAFFRDRDAFAAFEQAVVPQLFADKAASDAVRVWVAGCASGEEAYGLVMLLLEHAAQLPHPPEIQVFATDIDPTALDLARAGRYSAAIATDVSPARLSRFFTEEPGGYRVSAAVRDRVVFAAHNLLRDPPFSRLDLISCRNLLGQLSHAAREQAFDRFLFALCRGGFLFLGSTEAPDAALGQFTPVASHPCLYQLSASAPALWTAPVGLSPPRAHASPAEERAQNALRALHQRMLERHLASSVVVNADYAIVSLPERVMPFLQVRDGTLSFNLLHMVHPELRGDLHTTLAQAFQTGQPAEARGARLVHNGRALSVAVRVFPQHDPDLDGWFALVRFDAVEAGLVPADTPGELSLAAPQSRQLEADVQRLREQLDAAAAAQDVTVQALRTANEELLASNEELRITTEELESSKEELQSVNEELLTVNQELNHRVDELSAANDDLNNLMAATTIATLFLDGDLRITFFTPQASALFNLIRADEGRPLSHITHRLDYPALLVEAEAVLRSAQPVELEVGDNEGRYYLARIAPYRSTREGADGLVLTFVDISARHQAEAELGRAYAAEQAARIAAEQALQTRDQFISIASHELRTPMTALIGYAQQLARALARGSGDLERMVDRITQQALRLNELVGQLLDVSRLKRGQFAIERQHLDLAALGRQVVSDFRDLLPPGTAHTVALINPDASIPFTGDAARLEQVLHNLLSNAVKYSPQGGQVQVRVAQSGQEAVLEVSDQGIGIPAQLRDALFTPFYRAPNVEPHTGGFGLGLYIAHEIVQRHGGRIEVASAEGAGSTFRVVLPLHAAGKERVVGADPQPG